MEAFKSIALLAAGVCALAACDMKKKEFTRTTFKNPDTIVIPIPKTTSEKGYGALRDNADSKKQSEENYDESYSESDEVNDPSTSTGAGQSVYDNEYIDETSTDPNSLPEVRDPSLVPKNNNFDHTSSDPDPDQEQ